MERGPRVTQAAPPRWLTPVLVVIGATVLVASRVAARQGSLWEWDEAVFLLALDHFAPQNQVPHPPFYPGYVALGRLARALLGNGILALTWLSVAASCLAVLFQGLVAHEVLGSRRTAIAGAALFAVFPAGWLPGWPRSGSRCGAASVPTCSSLPHSRSQRQSRSDRRQRCPRPPAWSSPPGMLRLGGASGSPWRPPGPCSSSTPLRWWLSAAFVRSGSGRATRPVSCWRPTR